MQLLRKQDKSSDIEQQPPFGDRKISNIQPQKNQQKITYDREFSVVKSWGVKLHSHQTADQPPTNADQFLWFGRVWSGKNLPALIEERIYPRSTPAVSALYPWCTHAPIPLFPTYPRFSGWPIPALHDQPPTYSWYSYAHYAQYRPTPDLISTPGLKWIIQANVRA